MTGENLSWDHTYVGPVIIAICEFFVSTQFQIIKCFTSIYTCMCKPYTKVIIKNAMHAKMLERNSFAMQLEPLASEKIRTDSRIKEIQALTPFN